jgi:SAM-dependent methyltransferase
MRAWSRQAVMDAIASMEAAFPIEGYVTEGTRRALFHVTRELAHAAPAGQLQLLDVGCGPMDKTAVLQALGYECWGVDDLSDPWHHDAGHVPRIMRFAEAVGIRFVLAEGESAPVPEAHFDIATVFDVIEHLHASPRDLLNMAGQALKDDGLLCITMPNSVNLRKRLAVLAGRSNYPPVNQFFYSTGTWRGHVREYTLKETEYVCEAAGFDVLRASSFEAMAFDKLPGTVAAVYSKVVRLLPGCASGICVVARKPRGWVPAAVDSVSYSRAAAASLPPALR